MGDKMVPNPKLSALKQLRGQWLAQHESVKTALDRPAKDFGGGEVISGPWRDKVAPEVTGRRDRVNKLAESVLGAIDAAIAAEPAEVTESEAQTFRWMRKGNI
ncbi:hypothetical protein [Nonomuraea sp. NPDC050310]|uniref:hypothetical protein n=1 Tax=unclassified Nonomuraea TaxID=2593643 RepID=UPI0033DC086D